jgi:hypothetical protein
MAQTLGNPRTRPQLWNGSAWVDAPGDATNGLKVQGPLTDTQLRAAAVPVSMATQNPDVTDRAARLLGRAQLLDSGSVLIDPATKGQLPAALAAGGGLKVEGVAGGVAQPVSGTVTANAGTGPFPVSDNAGSLTVDAPVGTPVFSRLCDGAVALIGQKAMAASLPVVVASDQSAVPVTPPTLTKATQGATGFSTQDLKDAGRVAITITGFQVAGIITTEALFAASLVRAADGVAAAAAAQHTVTAAKRFRIQSIAVTVKNTAAAAGTSKLALRYRPAGGTVAITDSIVAILDIGSNNATAANYIGPYLMQIPDGFEMVAGATFGFTNLSSAVTMLHTITLIGFEY